MRYVPNAQVPHALNPALLPHSNSHEENSFSGRAPSIVSTSLKLPIDKLLALAQWLKLEPQFLRFGDETVKAVRASRKRWDEGIGYEEREIFDLFLKLPVPSRRVAREVIVALAKANAILPADRHSGR